MAIPLCGTFDYLVRVPEEGLAGLPWRAELATPVTLRGNASADDRLVGYSPALTIEDVGITPAIEDSWLRRATPRVLRSRISLLAETRLHAHVSSAGFHVDQSLVSALRPGDQLYLTRTGCGGLALSILKDAELIAAAGAVSAVPLGQTVRIGTPEVVTEAEALFRKYDPRFEFQELPLEVVVGNERCIVFSSKPRMQSYNIFVQHGVYPGLFGRSECVAISRRGSCPEVGAIASAQLMDLPDALSIQKWTDDSVSF